MRPWIARRLTDSIRAYYPGIEIIVLDDEDDMGVSAGRNKMVDMCRTEYCMILDDDCIFTEKTDLNLALELAKDYDMLGIQVGEKNWVLDYKGKYLVEGSVVRLVNETPLEFIPNVFIAKTGVLRKYRWDERLKVGEHFAYFFTHRGKINIGYTNKVEIRHEHADFEDYREFRKRATDYVKMFMRENGLTKRIELTWWEFIC